MRTHVVTNVVPAPSGLNVLRSDAALSEAVDRWVTPADPPAAAGLDDLDGSPAPSRCGSGPTPPTG